MSDTTTELERQAGEPVPQQARPRPVGFVDPAHERAIRALAALDGKRLADAEEHIAAIPDSPMIDRAWKLLLRGLVAIERGHLVEAEPLLLQASSVAFVGGLGVETSKHRNVETLDTDPLRLAARAFHHLGRVYRRADRPEDAYRTHLASYHLREQHGSYDELWQTATELGLDADVARRYEVGRRWHRMAIEAAEKASEEPQHKQAIAWTNLSTSFAQSGKHDEAVAAARTARDWWRQHDIAAATAVRADLKLGSVLLKQASVLHDRGDKRVKPILDEAVERLTTAHEELPAFGPDHAADARSCLEQKDLARRLLASLDL